MIARLRKKSYFKGIAVLLTLSLLFETFYPTVAKALTGGPSQPEVQSFEPIGTSEMVDVFSGDFTYNIPLMDVGGYPLNLSYSSGIGMDQEASWVGLGWNLNPGAITRNMRGLPDDFNGEAVTQEQNMKPNNTYGLTVGGGVEAFGWSALSLNYSFGINYNTYNGIGFEQTLSPTISMGAGGQESLTASLGLSLNANSNEGPSISPSLSFSDKMKTKNKDEALNLGGKVGVAVSSRAGLKALSIGVSGKLGPASAGENKKNPGIKQLKEALKDPDDENKVSVGGDPMRGFNGGATIDIGGSTYVPIVDMPRINTNFSFSAKFGGSFFGMDATYNLGGYFSGSKLRDKSRSLGAYGFLYSQNGGRTSMHDFNREKDGTFNKHSYNLPITNYTYDIYTIAGQGIGGMFRPFRSELGHVYDPLTRSYSASGSLGAELSPGNLVHVGIDVSVNGTESHSGDWSDENIAYGRTRFNSRKVDSDYEPVYFKEAGEKSVDEDPFYANVGGAEPYRLELLKMLGNLVVIGKGNLINKSGTTKAINTGGLKRAARVKRNQSISHLTAKEAGFFGTDKYVSGYSKPYHIAEIDVVRKDGARYIYGIAAYNYLQKEVSFNASGLSSNCGTGKVSYSAVDASTNNSKGIDNYYSSTTTPAYAHSYLLTSVFSPDYSDVDGVTGASPGDLGSYTRFDYDAYSAPGIQPYMATYRWRTPYSRAGGEANYNEGLKSDHTDDKGSYVYGEKEMWYLEKIETKTYVAVFHKSPRTGADARKDSRGVLGEHGQINSAEALPRLDSISLYALPDYQVNGNNAEPIKRVHFDYDYSLCKNTGNNLVATGDGSGKLTLKKVYFTYGRSFKGRLTAYEFTYADTNHDGTPEANPDYDIKGYDRWGNYKPNTGSCDPLTAGLTPAEFPYLSRDKTQADLYAASWSLTKIKLPSGGEIKVHYESDDYAYVQDRHAMQMLNIAGADSDNTFAGSSNDLYNTSTDQLNPYLFFLVPTGTTASDILNKYIRDIGDGPVYFRFLTSLKNGGAGTYDYVSGYFNLDRAAGNYYGVSTSGLFTYGYIRVKGVDEADGSGTNVHPVTKAAWHFGRKYNPRLVYNLPDPSSGLSLEDVLNALANASLIGSVVELFQGANGKLHSQQYARDFVTIKSWIRLYNAEGKKYGGGARVKKVEVSDNWSAMEDEGTGGDFSYGQSYEYLLSDGVTSSGVAAYEPQLGGDENPFHQPIFVEQKVLLAPDESNYVEEPFGESFFPGASVGYSRVKVKSLAKEKATAEGETLTRHATGHVVHEFYTAKDFPVITDRTDLDKARKAPSALSQIIKLSVKDYMTASQGFSVELNDMHGKPKAQWVYAEGQTTPISGVEYKYQTKTVTHTLPPFGTTVEKTGLDNKVVIIKPDGDVVADVEVGIDFDIVNDYREAKTYTFSAGGNGNLATFLAAIIPIAVPTIFPQFGNQTTRFRSAVTTKVINRYGILKETIAYDLGSKVSTENLAYDAQTGEVLLTRTKNDYDDYVYNFNYPAHWSYDRMGQAYKNIGVEFNIAFAEDGTMGGTQTKFSQTDISTGYKFVKGDEVIVYETTFGGLPLLRGKAWVWDVDENPSVQYLIKEDGTAFFGSSSGTAFMKVIRSGRRNMQIVPVGNVTSMVNPIDVNNDGTLNDINTGTPFASVIDASVVEFSENWGTFCNPKLAYETQACSVCEANYEMFTYTQDALNYLLSINSFCTDTYSDWPIEGSVPEGWTAGNCSSTTTYTGHYGFWGGAFMRIASCPVIFYPLDDEGVQTSLPGGYNWGDLVSLSNYQVSPTDENGDCVIGDSYYISATALFNNGTSIVYVPVLIKVSDATSGTCGPSGVCTEVTACPTLAGSVINPYVLNVRGNWRSKKSHLHLTNRDALYATSGSYNNPNTRKSGLYNSFSPFWTAPLSPGNPWTPNTTNWTWTSEVSKFSPYGFELENKDALDRFSAAEFGYNNTLAKAVAANARYNEIAFDGFEDYDLIYNSECCRPHFAFVDEKVNIVSTQAHTGRRSMKIASTDNIVVTYPMNEVNPSPVADDAPYTVKPADILGYFGPSLNAGSKKYVLSYWIKGTCLACFDPDYTYSYTGFDPQVKINGSTVTLTSTAVGEMIEGWQRIEYEFTVPNTTSPTATIEVKFTNSNGNMHYYLDDVRFHPFNATMKSYVYDPINYRLMAELDERNFATLYEYNEEGALLRIKKETEKGIMTIQESRNNTYKNPNP